MKKSSTVKVTSTTPLMQTGNTTANTVAAAISYTYERDRKAQQNRKHLNMRALRETFRDWLDEKGNGPSYQPHVYEALIHAHFGTLRKYLDGFAGCIEKEFGKKVRNANTVAFVYKFFGQNKRWIVKDFEAYFLDKTHLSFELNTAPHPLKPTRKITKAQYLERLNSRTTRQLWRAKTGQFVIMIMAEYVALHNYMWASKRRPPTVRTIDRWMKPYTWAE